MRNETAVYDLIQKQKRLENQSGCCVRIDGTSCVQSLRSECSNITSFFIKRNTPGPVCGLDPKYCLDDKESNWSSNINEWPICKKTSKLVDVSDYNHMKCKVTGQFILIWNLFF